MLSAAAYGSLGELLSDALVQWKREVALIEVDRAKLRGELTYQDCFREVARVAAHFAAVLPPSRPSAPLDPGAPRVAILVGNQSRWLLAACAAFRVGATVVPIDYKLAASEQLALLRHARADLLVTESPLARRFTEPFGVQVLWVDGGEGLTVPQPGVAWDDLDDAPMPQLAEVRRDDVACIVYSSGTSGTPKGCLLTHGAYLAQLTALMGRFPMRPGHRTFSILPTNHAIDFMVGFVGPFACGATVVHQRTLRPEFLASTMRDFAITHMAVVPVLLEALERGLDEKLAKRPGWQQTAVRATTSLNAWLTREAPRPELSRRLLPSIHAGFGGSLEVLFAGGAFVDEARAQRFYALGIPVVIGYGLTECCTVATLNRMRPYRADSVGDAVTGVEVRISAPDAEGVGEVWIRGATLMQGYLRDPELTASAIDADGWLHTGDLGRLDASRHLHLVGRAKNMVVTRGGKNVYPEEVEGSFADLPHVDEFAIFSSGYLFRGEKLTDDGLVLVVRSKSTQLVREVEVRNRKLAEHKRLRSLLVVTEAFPRTASMKIKREVLASQLAATHTVRDLVLLRAASTEGSLGV